MQSASPEMRLVIALSRLPLTSASRAVAADSIASGVNWDAALDRAHRWQVEPVVLGNLLSEFIKDIPDVVVVDLRRREQLAAAAAVTQALRVVDTANGLEKGGVPSLVLKGPAIAKIGYGEISRRTFSDIDLVVRRKDLERAQQHLDQRGYRPLFAASSRKNLIDGQHALEFEGSGPHIELHWALLPRYLRFDFDPEMLWSEAIDVEIGPARLKTLAPHHLFLYLCAHGAKHEWMMFRWLCDVAQVAARLTPRETELVRGLAEQTGSKRVVSLALRLVSEVFGEDPAPSLTSSFSYGDIDAVARVALSRLGVVSAKPASLVPGGLGRIHPYAEPLAFWIRSRERWTDRMVCGSRFIFEPAPDDKSVGPFSRLLRPVRLGVNALSRAFRSR